MVHAGVYVLCTFGKTQQNYFSHAKTTIGNTQFAKLHIKQMLSNNQRSNQQQQQTHHHHHHHHHHDNILVGNTLCGPILFMAISAFMVDFSMTIIFVFFAGATNNIYAMITFEGWGPIFLGKPQNPDN